MVATSLPVTLALLPRDLPRPRAGPSRLPLLSARGGAGLALGGGRGSLERWPEHLTHGQYTWGAKQVSLFSQLFIQSGDWGASPRLAGLIPVASQWEVRWVGSDPAARHSVTGSSSSFLQRPPPAPTIHSDFGDPPPPALSPASGAGPHRQG